MTTDNRQHTTTANDGFSVIIAVHDQAEETEHNLPLFLQQQCNRPYEVIVVDKMHDKDLEEWLEDMEVQHSCLNHTFCPASSRGLDIQRLALTLGAKAANYEWLAILPVDVNLPSKEWLQKLAPQLSKESDIQVCLTDARRRWGWFQSYLFRRKFSLYRSIPGIILCHRSTLIQGKPIKLTKQQIIKL